MLVPPFPSMPADAMQIQYRNAAAQLAWTKMLIAEAGENSPWITEFVIDSLVRTRSLQSLPETALPSA